MSTPNSSDPKPGHSVADGSEAAYTLDVVASVCGVSSQTVLHYHEQGLIHPVTADTAGCECFDDETVHRLRRIEHLRSSYGMEISALKLTLDLMDEIEHLRAELRSRR